MNMSQEELLRVTELTRRGQLMEATQAIQRALGARVPASPPTGPEKAPAKVFAFKPKAGAVDDIVDVPFRIVADQPSSFIQEEFSWGAEHYSYRLFVPSVRSGSSSGSSAPLPLVVMLHGCKQDAADFAQGTAMNALAEQHNCLVLYPQQLAKANSMGCWNWFEPQHQMRGAGEPAMIAALARHVAVGHGGDAQRIYIAGLSAGGAMAALTAGLYPDVFAAVGVHSGLPPGAATDVVSAFAAMRKGTRKPGTVQAAAVPTIVFHGTADKTVAPGNADSIVDDALAAWVHTGVPVQKTALAPEPDKARQRMATRTIFTTPDNKVVLENWSIAAGPHAWSGGNAQGSFTDPRGPDASRAMLAFFLQHALAPAAFADRFPV